MALTRPTFNNINSNVSARFNDPIVVLNAANVAANNQDIGFIFNRGPSGNVAVSWNETKDEFVLCYTTTSGQTDGNVVNSGNANVTVGNIKAAGYFYSNGAAFAGGGTPGGSNTQIQYNNNGIFSGASGVTTNGTALTVSSDLLVGPATAKMSSAVITSVGTTAKAIDAFSAATYRSAKYVISVSDITNGEYQTNDVVVVHNGTNVSISSYGLVYTGSMPRMGFSANILNGNVTLWGTGASANNVVKISATLISS